MVITIRLTYTASHGHSFMIEDTLISSINSIDIMVNDDAVLQNTDSVTLITW